MLYNQHLFPERSTTFTVYIPIGSHFGYGTVQGSNHKDTASRNSNSHCIIPLGEPNRRQLLFSISNKSKQNIQNRTDCRILSSRSLLQLPRTRVSASAPYESAYLSSQRATTFTACIPAGSNFIYGTRYQSTGTASRNGIWHRIIPIGQPNQRQLHLSIIPNKPKPKIRNLTDGRIISRSLLLPRTRVSTSTFHEPLYLPSQGQPPSQHAYEQARAPSMVR